MPRKSEDLQTGEQVKARLQSELMRLGLDDQALRQAATGEAHRRVITLLRNHFADFSAAQQARIRALAGVGKTPKDARPAREKAPPRGRAPGR